MYKKRLIATIVSIFAIGVVFGVAVGRNDAFSFHALFGVLSLVSLVVFALSFTNKSIFASKRVKAVALAVAAFSFGVFRIGLQNEYNNNFERFAFKEDNVLLQITEINTSYIDTRVITSDIGLPKGTNIRLYNNEISEDSIVGDLISADVEYKSVYKNSLLSNGIVLTASGDIKEQKQGSGLFYTLRKSVSENSKILFSDFEEAQSIAKGVTVGDRSDIDSGIFSVYKSAGMSHILAISGLHITLISMGIFELLKSFTLSRKLSGFIASLVAIGYTALVGFTPGAVRSAVMLVVIMVSRMFLRRADSITYLFISLFLLLFVNPFAICSLGLQLSFLSTLGIILFEPLLNDFQSYCAINKYDVSFGIRILMTVLPKILVPISVSFVASIFSFPVLCVGFDTVSYISPVVNLLCVPLFSLGVKLTFLSFLIAPISSVVAKVVAYPAGFIFKIVTDFAQFLYDKDFGVVSVHNPLMILPFVVSVLMICVLVFLTRNKYKIFTGFSVVFCILLLFCGIYNEMFVVNHSVAEYGNKNSEYFYYQTDKYNVYVDLGGYISATDCVYENGRTSVDKYLLTCLDRDSLKRLDYISGNMRIKDICVKKPSNSYEIALFSEIKSLANKRKCDIITFEEYFELEFDDDKNILVFGNGDGFADETLICVDHNGTKIRYLANGFDNAVDCDVAVLASDYMYDNGNIIADEIFVFSNDEKSSDVKNLKNFGEYIRVIFKESGYKIYEH